MDKGLSDLYCFNMTVTLNVVLPDGLGSAVALWLKTHLLSY